MPAPTLFAYGLVRRWCHPVLYGLDAPRLVFAEEPKELSGQIGLAHLLHRDGDCRRCADGGCPLSVGRQQLRFYESHFIINLKTHYGKIYCNLQDVAHRH